MVIAKRSACITSPCPTTNYFEAALSGDLHRNFMGYTQQHTQLLVGLGVSSISDSWYGFAQNVKTVEEYLALIGAGEFALMKGHLLSEEDLMLRRHILDIMCKGQTQWIWHEKRCEAVQDGLVRLRELEDDGLIELSLSGLKVTLLGKRFLRNICMP